jgi:hypothetical protein
MFVEESKAILRFIPRIHPINIPVLHEKGNSAIWCNILVIEMNNFAFYNSANTEFEGLAYLAQKTAVCIS